MPVLRGLTELEAQALGLPAGSCEITSAGAQTATTHTHGRWRQAKDYLLPPDPAQPGPLRYQMRIGRDVHYQDDGGNWRTIDLDWRADPANPGELVTDRNDIYTRVTRFGVAVWDRKSRVGVRWSTTVRPTTEGRRAVFPKDGLEWAWSATTSGLKLESEPVIAPRGPQTYEWRYLVIDLNRPEGFDLAGTLSVDAGGNLVGDGFVTPRAFVIGANRVRYDCGAWQVVGGKTRAVSFAFDDSALPPEAYPYAIDPTTTFASTVSADDAWVFKTGATWLPTGATTVNTNQANFAVMHAWSAPDYYRTVGVVKWDTSSVPDTATINSASFQGYAELADNANGMSICAEWYDPGTIDAADYTETIATTAFAPLAIATLGSGAKTLALLNVASSINKTGHTGLRWHLNNTTTPTGINRVAWSSFDHATTANRPQLIIDYTDGAGPTPVPLDLGTATASGAASATATLSLQMGLAATGTASAVATATLSRQQGLSATAQATGSATASLSTAMGLAATATGQATAAATLSRLVGLIATATATGTATAELTIPTGTAAPLDLGTATASAAGQAAASLGMRMGLTATATATGSATASLAVLMGLSGHAQATAGALARLGLMQGLTATATAQGIATVVLTIITPGGRLIRLAGEMRGPIMLAGEIRGVIRLQGEQRLVIRLEGEKP